MAKISHDLRNILTTAQLFADRIEGSADPAVARSAPKLIGSISRAVSLCESTLAFGKAEEAPPQLARFALAPLVGEVAEGDGLAEAGPVTCLIDVPPGLTIRADREQLYRVLSNLIRNARQAIEATGQPGTIEISAGEGEADWWIRIGDTGPGLPQKARENLFAAFQGSARKGHRAGPDHRRRTGARPWRAAGAGAQRRRGDGVHDPPAARRPAGCRLKPARPHLAFSPLHCRAAGSTSRRTADP